MAVTVLRNVGNVSRREHAESVGSVRIETEVDAVSAVLVDASRGVGEVFACYVVDVFDAQNFFNGCIANVARASNVVFVIEFVRPSGL